MTFLYRSEAIDLVQGSEYYFDHRYDRRKPTVDTVTHNLCDARHADLVTLEN